MRNLLILLTCASLAAPVSAQEAPPGGVDLSTFDRVWEIIDKKHFDPDHNGVDWDSARLAFRPRVQVAMNRVAAREIVTEMLALLGQSHFLLIAQETLGKGDESSTGRPTGTVDFDIRVRGEAAWVSLVERGSPAYAAGVRRGWSLIAIDGEKVPDLLAALPKEATLRPATANRRGLILSIDGPLGTSARFTFKTGDGGVLAPIELSRAERDAIPFDIQRLPRFYLRLRAERHEREHQTIGSLHLSNRFGGVEGQVHAALDAMADCDGVESDLRGNTGNTGGDGSDGLMACRVAGHFFEQRTALAARSGKFELAIRPRGIPLHCPLLILTDETTGSASEVFSGGMQALGRARVIGETSAGAALPSTLTKLPNGDFPCTPSGTS
ncbi:MAG: carboxyl-terminal processing protease [Planctomycetota bacterium]|jgi:carboxyl-terminal processing protease